MRITWIGLSSASGSSASLSVTYNAFYAPSPSLDVHYLSPVVLVVTITNIAFYSISPSNRLRKQSSASLVGDAVLIHYARRFTKHDSISYSAWAYSMVSFRALVMVSVFITSFGYILSRPIPRPIPRLYCASLSSYVYHYVYLPILHVILGLFRTLPVNAD